MYKIVTNMKVLQQNLSNRDMTMTDTKEQQAGNILDQKVTTTCLKKIKTMP
jgi:hypothetical protein